MVQTLYVKFYQFWTSGFQARSFHSSICFFWSFFLWDRRENQLRERWLAIPLFTTGFILPRWLVVWDFWTINRRIQVQALPPFWVCRWTVGPRKPQKKGPPWNLDDSRKMGSMVIGSMGFYLFNGILGGGFKYFFLMFTPIWGRFYDPFWRTYFSNGLLQSPLQEYSRVIVITHPLIHIDHLFHPLALPFWPDQPTGRRLDRGQHVKQSFRKWMRRLDEDSALGSSPVRFAQRGVESKEAVWIFVQRFARKRTNLLFERYLRWCPLKGKENNWGEHFPKSKMKLRYIMIWYIYI